MSFKEVVDKLTEFWSRYNCIWLVPWDTIVGAATYHPTCFFESLSHNNNNYMYMNCCRRLADGRDGQSAQRLLKHHQFQVTLKDTLNVRELYLESLRYLGIDITKRDIKFIENDWTTTSLGAFGRGWEAWCDLTEITQFTFFQVMGDVSVPKITTELAYGIERLVSVINCQPINNCMWDQHVTYGEIRQREERELSMMYREFELFTPEDMIKSNNLCHQLIDNNILYGAYNSLLHSIYIFNVLDARRRIGPLEHKEYMDEMRSIANKIATQTISSI